MSNTGLILSAMELAPSPVYSNSSVLSPTRHIVETSESSLLRSSSPSFSQKIAHTTSISKIFLKFNSWSSNPLLLVQVLSSKITS